MKPVASLNTILFKPFVTFSWNWILFDGDLSQIKSSSDKIS